MMSLRQIKLNITKKTRITVKQGVSPTHLTIHEQGYTLQGDVPYDVSHVTLPSNEPFELVIEVENKQ